MSDLERVKADIRAAFADVAFPGDRCLVNSREGTEPALLDGERTWFEHARHKSAMFNAQEVAAIVGYLRCRLASGELTEFEKGRIRQALG